MEDVLKAIYNKLKGFGVEVFDKRPSANTNYPFIIYTVNEPSVNVNPAIYLLTINLWTESGSYEYVESLATSVNRELRDGVLSENNVAIKLKKVNELRIADPNRDIKRKEITYQMRVFEWNK